MSQCYGKPPIAEAYCVFSFLSSNWDMTVPGSLYGMLKDVFPEKGNVNEYGIEVAIDSAGIPTQKLMHNSNKMQLVSKAKNAFVQFGQNYLAINCTNPYIGWEKFYSYINLAFAAYSKCASPLGIQRIGVRYINKIEYSKETIELKDYFNIYPHVGNGITQDYCNCIVGIETSEYDGKYGLRITMSTEPQAIVLDLDYFSRKPEVVSMDDALNWVADAHTVIGRNFESCITDKSRVLFERKAS